MITVVIRIVILRITEQKMETTRPSYHPRHKCWAMADAPKPKTVIVGGGTPK